MTQQYSVYPIIWAAGRGHAEIVHLLLQHGAKVNCSDKVTMSRKMFVIVFLSYTDCGATPFFIYCPTFVIIISSLSHQSCLCCSFPVWHNSIDLGCQERPL